MYKLSVTSNTPAAVRWSLSAWLLAGVAGAFSALPAAALTVPAMGKITLTVGQASVTSANGSTRTAQRGDDISVGDRIETTLNGHVHVRFVDGALVSVRPASELLVEDYRYDPAAVERSQVKFKLSRGTARAISGAAAEGARDHFRLNTPLVAIGIRGTDFVVHSEDRLTTAAVSYGAIIMAPFGEGCKAQGSGPCATASAKLLSADMSGMLAEYRSGVSQTELKQATTSNSQMSDLTRTASLGSAKASGSSVCGTSGTAALASGAVPASTAVTPEASLVAVNELPRIPYRTNNLVDPDSRSADRVTVMAAQTVETVKPSAVAPTPMPVSPVAVLMPSPAPVPSTPTPTPVSVAIPTPLPTAPVVAVPTVVVAVVAVITPPALAWGRWGSGALGPDDFAVARTDAQIDRTVTVGNTNFVLYRHNGEFDFARFPASQGETTFLLDKGFARYTDGSGQSSAASVLGGTLGINFSTRQFDTALNLSSAATGAQTLAMQGAVDRGGLFVAAQDGQRVAGAIALDGKSAGYLFDKAVASGTLSGITQWKAK